MNKKGAGKLLGYILAVIVLGVMVLGVYGFFKNQGSFFQFLPGFNFTRPAVEGDAIVRYSIGSDSVEYYDGVQWYSFKGRQVLGSYEINPDVLKSEFNFYWYQNRDTSERINVAPPGSPILPKTAQIISFEKGPAPYAGLEKDKPFMGYTKVEYGVQSLASGTKQNYVLNYDDKLYNEGEGETGAIRVGDVFNTFSEKDSLTVKFEVENKYFIDKRFTEEMQKLLSQFNSIGARGFHVTDIGSFISFKGGKFIAKDMVKSDVSNSMELGEEGIITRFYAIGDWKQYKYKIYYEDKFTNIYLVVRAKEGGSYPIKYDTIVEAVPEYSSKAYKLTDDKTISLIALKSAVAKWRDEVLTEPADINGNKYCLRSILSSNGPTLVAYLDQPTGQGRCR